MRYLILFLILTVGLLNSCQPDKGTSKEKISPQQILLGKWETPKVEIKGLDGMELSPDERRELTYVVGIMNEVFRSMTVEFFDDNSSMKNSYHTTVTDPGSKEPYSEFGDYELLANGRRLVLYDTGTKSKLDVEVTVLSPERMKWRMQFADLAKFGGGDELDFDWDEEMPNAVMYLGFERKKATD